MFCLIKEKSLYQKTFGRLLIGVRNEHEAQIGELIQEFKAKIEDFFDYVRNAKEGERLIVKMKSHVSEDEIYMSEDEIYTDFAKIYRRYKAINRKKVGEFFSKKQRIYLKCCVINLEIRCVMAIDWNCQ